MQQDVFKSCNSCGRVWHNRDEFLADRSLTVNGYMADFESLDHGLFLFTHNTRACGSTLSIFAACFWDLYSGPHYSERKALSRECPRYCLDRNQLGRCNVVCECAFVREVLQVVRARLECAACPHPFA